MRIRPLALVAVILPALAFVACEGRRAWLAFLLWRGNYPMLERWGGEEVFLPAVGRMSPGEKKEAGCSDALAAWATRRYQSRFPEEHVYDLTRLPTGELMLLLGKPPWLQSQTRLVVLDPDHSDELIAASEPQENNAHGFDLEYFPGWEGPAVLTRTWGTGQGGMLYRYRNKTLCLVSCRGSRGNPPWFLCWTGLRLIDVDGDGIPEVQGYLGKWACCPRCDRDGQANLITWKLVGDSYYPWTERGEECGLECEFAWSTGWSY